MHPILRNVLAFLVGIIVGGAVNMGIIVLGGSILPPPPGVDVNDIASINAHIHEYSVIQLMVPFLAHSLGALVGAFLVAFLAVSRQMTSVLIIGGFNLIGGIMAVQMIPNAPVWFDVLDLLGAYIPMAWVGGKLGMRMKA